MVDCKFDEKKETKTSKLLALALLPVIIGTSASTLMYNFLSEKFKSDASFIYVDTGVQTLKLKSKNYTSLNPDYDFVTHTTIILKNDGDKPGIITAIAVSDQEKENEGRFFASHSVTPLSLRKNEYQEVESLLCPAKTYCEISFKGDFKVNGFDVSETILKLKLKT